MASFSHSRTSRLAKESYVRSSPNERKSSAVLPSESSSSGEGHDTANLVQSAERSIYSLPSTLQVQTSSTSGRGLFPTTTFRPGGIIISIKPYISVLSNQYLSMYCSNCFGPSTHLCLKRCTTCHTVCYCDSACQAKDWSLHKQECLAIQRWSNSAPSHELSIPGDAVRCLGRLLWKRQKKGSGSQWVKGVDAMQSHRASLQSSSFELHTHLSHSLVRYLGLSSSEELVNFGFGSARDLVNVISQFITNTFTVTSPTLTPIGVSISPTVALINHSCDPNAVVVFPRASESPSTEEPSMQVIALRSIEPNEEILTSYIDTTLPSELRQTSLKETYNFDCRCTLCTSSPDADPRVSIWCPKACGGTCPLPTEDNSLTRCTKCKAVLKNTDTVLDALRIGQEALDKATALQLKDPIKSKQLTTNLIPILTSSGFTPSCHPLLALSRLHQSLLISSLPSPPTQEALDDAIRAATRSCTGLMSLLHYGHPVRGIALTELGKLLAVDEPGSPAKAGLNYPPSGPARLKLAYETLVKARDELLAGFGSSSGGGKVGRDVREMIIGLEKEIGVWKEGIKNVLEDTPKMAVTN